MTLRMIWKESFMNLKKRVTEQSYTASIFTEDNAMILSPFILWCYTVVCFSFYIPSVYCL